MNTKEILKLLPKEVSEKIESLRELDKIQEIRLKINKPIIIEFNNGEKVLPYILTENNLKAILQRLSGYSIYAFEEELKNGYISIKGGHRIGVCGTYVMEKNKVKTIKNIASINIRISKEVVGSALKVIDYIVSEGNYANTIVISPPKCGKTTILRDITRIISEGYKNISGKKVSVIDERSEIAACHEGIPQHNVGIRTDVLDNCLKCLGIIMAIRSMSPEIIVCDEIGTKEDMESVLSALNSGVNVITSIHGFGIEDFIERKIYKNLVDNKVFERGIVLSNASGAGTLEIVYDFTKDSEIFRRGHD